MSIYKRGRIYWYKFMWNGALVRESTKQGNDRTARQMEAAHRTSLAKGLVDIRDKEPSPELHDFIVQKFLPYIETKKASKPGTLRYYKDGVKLLLKSEVRRVRLEELNDTHAQRFAAQNPHLSPSGINRGLRTLRRVLYLALEWGKLDRPPEIHLVPGERERDRVLTEQEEAKFLAACPQPWRDCATMILDEGMRPSEVFRLEWSHVSFVGRGFVRIVEGKSKASRRTLPLTPRVYQLLAERHDAAVNVTEGWIFPSTSRVGHLTGDSAKEQHSRALRDSGVEPFEPYVMRHTALTRIADKCRDPFAVMKIAGHSTLALTQRYCHPPQQAVERAFDALVGRVSTKLGTGTRQRRRINRRRMVVSTPKQLIQRG